MQETIFTQFILPATLAFIMFGMGLSLIKADFSRLFLMPKPIIVGLFGQLVLLPCFGGSSSNLICHAIKANLALSVSLTAITTFVCVITTPMLNAPNWLAKPNLYLESSPSCSWLCWWSWLLIKKDKC